MDRTRPTIAALLLALSQATAVRADDPPATAPVDKSAYTLLHPVPDDVPLRPFNPDRPSVTTGPFTVDPGHVQVESSFIQYTQDQSTRTGGDGGHLYDVLPTELRVGLTAHTEIDLTVSPFEYLRTPARPAPTAGPRPSLSTPAGHTDGFGDLQLQAKFNLLGDDGGDVAFGVVPYLTLPTAARSLGTGRVAGGVILPVQVNLPADFTAAGQVEFDFPRNDDNTRTGFDCLHTVYLGRPIVGPLDAYGEFVGVSPVALGHGYQAYADVGLTYAVSDDVQLDVAADLGCSRDTARYTLLTGITIRR